MTRNTYEAMASVRSYVGRAKGCRDLSLIVFVSVY